MMLGFRLPRQSRSYSVAVTCLVTIGVAVGVLMFTVYNGALLDPWPYEGGDRLVTFRGNYPTVDRTRYPLWSAQDYAELRALDNIFEHVIAGRGRDANLAAAGGAELVRGAELTPNAFEMLGVLPLHGRLLDAADAAPGAPPVVLIGHGLWQRRYGGTPAAIGQFLPIDGIQHQIVGVMPPRFLWWGSELWLPLAVMDVGSTRDDRRYVVQARLRHGVGTEQANAALHFWARGVERTHAGAFPEYRNWSADVSLLVDAVVRDVREVLDILLAAVAALAIVAGFNIANLFLARAAARRREFAVRAALGASLRRLATSLVVENLSLVAIGAGLGVGIAWLMIGPVVSLIPFGYLPAEGNLSVTFGSVGVAGAIAFAVAVLAALPALAYLRRLRLSDALHEARSTGTNATVRARSAFVIAQFVLATVVVSVALAVGIGFRDRLATDPGFDRHQAVKIRLALPRESYATRSALREFAVEFERQLAGAPGVDAIGIGTTAPLSAGSLYPLAIRGGMERGDVESRYEIVGGDWFAALGVPLVTGRVFDERERAGSQPVVVVNAAFARAFLASGDPIGVQIRAGPEAEGQWATIVGVVGDTRVGGVDGEVRPLVFRPLVQSVAQLRNPVVLARGTALPEQQIAMLRHIVAQIDPTIAVYEAATLDEIVRDALGGQRLAAWMLAGFAIAVTLLAALGVYGIIAYIIQLSRAEYGLRMALGATRADIVHVVGRRGLLLAGIGIGLGIIFALGGLRLIAAMFTHPVAAPATMVPAACALLLIVAAIASGGPALRASRTDPAEVMRGD